MATLNETFVRNMAPRSSTYRVTDDGRGSVPGLAVACAKGNTKFWQLAYSLGGQRKFMKLASTDVMGLAAVRDLAREKLTMVAKGVDPKDEKKHTPRATVKQLIEDYLSDVEARGKKAAKVYRQMLNRNVPKKLMKKEAAAVTSTDIHGLLRDIFERGAKVQVVKNQRLLSQIWNFGIRQDLSIERERLHTYNLTDNVVDQVPKLRGVVKASPVLLTMEQIAAAYVESNKYQSWVTPYALRWHLRLGGCRVLESIERRFEDIIESQGYTCMVVPAEKHKMGRRTVIPLTPPQIELLDEIRDLHGHKEVMFPGYGGTYTPLTVGTLSHATRLMRKRWPAIGSDFTPRYVRSAAKTWLVELAGIERWKVDVYHGHMELGVSQMASRHYAKADYLDVKMEVSEAWQKLLDEAIAKYKAEK
jgi:integrase